MRTTGSFCMILGTLLLSACTVLHKGGKKAAVPGTWQAIPVVIDGDSKEWPSPYPNYDNKAKIAYATSNDAEYLYITAESGDELTQLKILKGGMTVSVDTGDSKAQAWRIGYPLPDETTPLDLQPGEGGKGSAMSFERQMASNIKKLTEQANQFSLEGFEGCSGGYVVSQTTPCGIKVKARLDEYRQLVWEAAIPIKAILGRDKLSPADAGRIMTVGYTIRGMKAPKSSADNVNNNMSAPMGGGGASNSRQAVMAGSGQMQQANPLGHLYQTTKTYKLLSLQISNTKQ